MAPNTNTPPDPKARQQEASAGSQAEKQDDPQQTTVAELPKALESVTSVEEVKAMKAADDRTTAQPIYDARIEELEKELEKEKDADDSNRKMSAEEAAAKPKASGKNARVARTRVKYEGRWYAPGETVPFASADDAEPYEASRALQPAQK